MCRHSHKGRETEVDPDTVEEAKGKGDGSGFWNPGC